MAIISRLYLIASKTITCLGFKINGGLRIKECWESSMVFIVDTNYVIEMQLSDSQYRGKSGNYRA